MPSDVATGQQRTKRLEKALAVWIAVLGGETRQRRVEHGLGPAALVHLLGRDAVDRLELIAPLAVVDLERQDRLAAAAFHRADGGALVGDEVPDGGQEERAEPAAFLPRVRERAFLEHSREKCLRQVGGVVDGRARAPNERVDRKPVQLAQRRERRCRVRRGRIAGRHHQAPARRRESTGTIEGRHRYTVSTRRIVKPS
jgi:hypothetical protein